MRMRLLSLPVPVLPLAMLAFAACTDSTAPTTSASAGRVYYAAYPSTGDYRLQLYGVAPDGGLALPLLSDSLRQAVDLDYYFIPWVSGDGLTIKVLVGTDSGGALLSLDPFGTVKSSEPYEPVAQDSWWGWPTLSPDGRWHAWFSGGYLNVAHPDGTGLKRTYFDSLAVFAGGAPAWSRDGKWLAYFMGVRGSNFRLWTLRLSDGFRRPVTSHGGSRPTWSRDGKWLTFVSSTGINRVRADGTGPEQMVYIGSTYDLTFPSWSPGDSLIGLVALDGGLIVMHPDGSAARRISGATRVEAFGW
jgi:hypothetical protein